MEFETFQGDKGDIMKELTPEVTNIFNELDGCYLECDGLSTVISSLLTSAGVPHRLLIGSVRTEDHGGIPIHLWIEAGEYVIDFRLRMWLGDDPSIPHGFFKNIEYSHITYSGTDSESLADRHPIAKILCSTAGLEYDDLAMKLKKTFRGAD